MERRVRNEERKQRKDGTESPPGHPLPGRVGSAVPVTARELLRAEAVALKLFATRCGDLWAQYYHAFLQ